MISRSAADDVAPSAPREDFEPRQGANILEDLCFAILTLFETR
jgi:hypothetical protein